MMRTYIVLLRGINVSGQKKIKMEDLRRTLENIGLNDVTTYIQSGNIVFNSDLMEIDVIENTIHDAILNDFAFEVPTLVVTGDGIKQILGENPFVNEADENQLYFVLLKQHPKQELVDGLNEQHFPDEDFHITPACVYLRCKRGYGNAKLNNNLIERKLKVEATTRNLKTMQKLLEMTSQGKI